MKLSLALFQFLFIFFVLWSNPTSAQCLDHQKSSLLTLFGSTPTRSWTPNTDCCLWKGVTCDGYGHVTGLDLTACSIRASINSTSLLSLFSLKNLNLSLNFFDSSIPVSLGGLSKLTHLNLSQSGFSGPVPVEFSRIKRLESLDLSSSNIKTFSSLSFASPDFGYVIGNLSELRELYLDGVDISSTAPKSLEDLTNLTSLHLSWCNLTGEFPTKVFQLQNLETIDLSMNPLLLGTLPELPSGSRLEILSLSSTNFSGELPISFGNLRHLRRLDLTGCHFSGMLPLSMGAFSQLSHLEISVNNIGGEVPWLGNLTRLVLVSLSWNRFSGEIPSLENLSQLVRLDLSSNMFSGRIPSLGSLKNVGEIYLSNNNLSGAMDLSFGEGLSSLWRLDLHNNSLSGKIPASLFTLPSLQELDLSQNQFDAPLGEFGNASSSLMSLDLSNNKLQGPIPGSIFQLIGLRSLSLSSNIFNGTLDFSILQNLTDLFDLGLSNNRLSISPTGINTSLQISRLELSSCNLRKFPYFLRNLPALSKLDLSNNSIDGVIPKWIWSVGNGFLQSLNLSQNMLYGFEIPIVDLISLTSLTMLDLHSNRLQGSIPIPPPFIQVLDYSRNYFTSVIPANISLYLNSTVFLSLSENNISGEIPPSICNASNLVLFDLSNNNLSGAIPLCLSELRNLRILNLGKNNFRGDIPNFGRECNLQTLNLNRNRLEGSLPVSLTHCKQLEVLNIGNNRINETFPSWLGSLANLQVLILRSNKFYGPIYEPKARNAFSKLRIIDLSFNGFTGNLSSKWIKKLEGMRDNESKRNQILEFYWFPEASTVHYQERVIITLKGSEMEFLKVLTIFSSIDFSNNKFHGSIPKEIGNLKSLLVLNMSHNEFSGPIPSSFGNLRQLESLDLSMNRLSGEIPVELTALSFLSVLNLSQNRLVGRIPQAQQFLTFSNDSFEGNPGLCGPPLSMQCEAPQEPEAPGQPQSANLPSRKHFDWRYMCMGLGFGFGNWMVIGPLIFWPRGRLWYYKHVDKILAMATVWWDTYGMPITVLKQRADDRVRHTLLRRGRWGH